MKNFKVFYFAIAFIGASFFTQNVQAQMSAGAGLSYGFEIEELGLNLRFNYGITEKINANANFTFWFIGEEGVSFSTFNIDGHYYFHSSEKFNAYGLAGINFARAKTDAIDLGAFGSFPAVKTTETGLNVGAGVDLGLTNALRFFGELKYVISDADQLVATAGVKFAF